MKKRTIEQIKEIELLEAQTPVIHYDTLNEALAQHRVRAEQVLNGLKPDAFDGIQGRELSLAAEVQ